MAPQGKLSLQKFQIMPKLKLLVFENTCEWSQQRLLFIRRMVHQILQSVMKISTWRHLEA